LGIAKSLPSAQAALERESGFNEPVAKRFVQIVRKIAAPRRPLNGLTGIGPQVNEGWRPRHDGGVTTLKASAFRPSTSEDLEAEFADESGGELKMVRRLD
jgi:hypothetical protein